MTTEAVKKRVRKGILQREHQGVYVVGHLAETRWGREAGALLAAGEGAVISHWSAARLHGLAETNGRRPFPLVAAVDVTIPSHRRAERATINVHRADLDATEITTIDGVATTTVDRTIRDLAATATRPDLERLIAEAHGRGWDVEPLKNARGAVALRAVVNGTVVTRSEAERALRRLVKSAGLPLPETNVKLGEWEIDALWRRERVAVEIDSWAWHGTRRSFERDRRKDRALRAAGLSPVRITATQITTEPAATVADLAATLARAA